MCLRNIKEYNSQIPENDATAQILMSTFGTDIDTINALANG